jgi:hypothetical protein
MFLVRLSCGRKEMGKRRSELERHDVMVEIPEQGTKEG